MNNKNCELLLEYVQEILSGSDTGHFNISELDEPYQELGRDSS